MDVNGSGSGGWLACAAACALALSPLSPASASHAGPASPPRAGASPAIPPPVPRGRLAVAGHLRDGATVAARGLSWRPGRLPRGTRLLSFEVGYTWQRCQDRGRRCAPAADSTVTPFAAWRYIVGHGDTGTWLKLTETAAEVVETDPATFSFRVVRRSASVLTGAAVRAYPPGEPPRTEFVNGTPEPRTASAEEYFQVDAPHYDAADGPPVQEYRVDGHAWRPLPDDRALYTGRLPPGPHRVAVRTSDHAGATVVAFRWRVVPLPAPLPCRPARGRLASGRLAPRRLASGTPVRGRPAHGRGCWYPPHLAADHRPMRWDWQIGRVTPLQRTGARAVDVYDIDGFLTTRAQVTAIRSSWQARSLPHPRTICYLDLAWEDYRPDASPGSHGSYFPAATLGNVYYGYPQERWVDFRQLDALKPMLRERIAMCARKGFDAVEFDDIDGFDPPSTTGFRLTPGDAQNFLAYALNEVHRFGMTALWKNSPYLAWWGRRYADGAVVEECYTYHACFASWLRGSRQYGITCTGLAGRTPCGWDAFTADVTQEQRTGKWVGEAEYGSDGYVCDPGQRCSGKHAFAAFCRVVYSSRHGFAAVKFDVDLDGKVFFPCRRWPRGR